MCPQTSQCGSAKYFSDKLKYFENSEVVVMNVFFSIGIKIFWLCAIKFGGMPHNIFPSDLKSCRGTVLFAAIN